MPSTFTGRAKASRSAQQPFCSGVAIAAWLVGAVSVMAVETDFERHIQPILEDRCWYCHGEGEQESGLRLDSRANLLRGGDSGIEAVVPGHPEKSYLIDAVTHADPDVAMPPDDDKLTDEEIELLTRWIDEGAVWPGQMDAVGEEKSDHWSFQPIVRPPVPGASDDGGASNPIDAFLLKSLRERGLTYAEAADPRALIRRVSVVLSGIAPTPEETERFLGVWEIDEEVAYQELVERLLASPHFGERWAQHWLDVIRWAETNGSESNLYRKNAWIYRDYVIRAFNEDKPYDQFLFEQIAGDTVEQGDATGYLVAGPHVPQATVGREPAARRQARADRLDEILQTIGASAMGVTIGCARCHNHKFDPISIRDYYAMAAVFEDIEFGSRFPEFGEEHPRKVRGKAINRQIRELRRELREKGPWIEDWTGYKELHFPTTDAEAVRLTFLRDNVRIDELEIFDAKVCSKNHALASAGAVASCSEEITPQRTPVEKINDGRYGSEVWSARVGKEYRGKGSQVRPWVQLTFPKTQSIGRIRISTNRSDYDETDYLDGLNKLAFEPFQVEVLSKAGEWTPLTATKEIKKRLQGDEQRIATLETLQGLIAQASEQGPKPSFIARFIPPAQTHILARGSPENPRDEVSAAGLSELDGELGLGAETPGKQRRREFARWLTRPTNPLTARVAANRIWHHVFGRGIVPTPSDFGAAGAPPSHPELLDWLASELVRPTVGRPWSIKRLVRMLVTSRAFRQSSRPSEAGLLADADAALLWRYPPKRVEAEVIRDSILRASGRLSSEVGGRSFRIHNVKQRYAQWEVSDNYGPETWRRMIYQERMRRVDDHLFTAFDFPDCGQVRAKRPVSTTPLQALNLMNSDFVLDQSRRIADRAAGEVAGEEALSIERCFELLLGRKPDAAEREASLALARKSGLAMVCRVLINSNEFAFLP
ncbi:Planctomycete cytochrome C [Planctomycetes bacterium MalM25]|nr:Planctomycete cytochrome C [Planctomycetes bacterium MalM25]